MAVIFSAKKKELVHRTEELERFGLTMGDFSTGNKSNRFFLCFIRACLIFMATYGTVGGVVSAIGLQYCVPIVIAALFVLAFFSAFLYYNKISFYIGYIVVFAGFIVFSISSYWYINSGYQAFVNVLYNKYSDFFALLSVREATEFVTDRYVTVSYAMIFIGWFFSILLNIAISGYMNLPATFLLTFLPLQTVFYIDMTPAVPYLVMLITVYVTVALLRRSGHFSLPYKNAKGEEFDRTRKKNRAGTEKQSHVYLSSSSGMLTIAGYSLLIATVFLLVVSGIFSELGSKYVSNKVKNTTDAYVKTAVQEGLTSLLNRYRATGGLAEGRLGGIGNVAPDFQTDMYVRFVPYSTGTVYLKAYTGVTYENNSFKGYDNDAALDVPPMPDPAFPAGGEYSKMWIENIDAGHDYYFRPYDSYYATFNKSKCGDVIAEETTEYARQNYDESFGMVDSEDEINGFSSGAAWDRYEVLFVPYEMLVSYQPNPNVTEEYEEYVYDTYLTVPEEHREELEGFLEEAGIEYDASKWSDVDINDADAYRRAQSERLDAVSDLAVYFKNNFDYTMSPGVTPSGEDVVTYFLTEQQRGFCAHFASSSALLLRCLGIPTRYVEGYAISYEDVMDSDGVAGDVSNWQISNETYENAGIVEVDVTDASAHAWIEIYLDGYGWIPYEMTPPSDNDELSASQLSLYSLFEGLLYQTARNTVNNNDDSDDGFGGDIGRVGGSFKALDFLFRPFCWIAGTLGAVFVGVYMYRYLQPVIRSRKMLKNGDYAGALLERYKRIPRTLYRRRLLDKKNQTLRDTEEFVKIWVEKGKTEKKQAFGKKKKKPVYVKAPSITSDEVSEVMGLLRKAAYSGETFGNDEYLRGTKLLRKMI